MFWFKTEDNSYMDLSKAFLIYVDESEGDFFVIAEFPTKDEEIVELKKFSNEREAQDFLEKLIKEIKN